MDLKLHTVFLVLTNTFLCIRSDEVSTDQFAGVGFPLENTAGYSSIPSGGYKAFMSPSMGELGDGVVTGFETYLSAILPFEFQIWRPASAANSYTLVFTYRVETPTLGNLRVNLPESEQFRVKAGDKVGFYADSEAFALGSIFDMALAQAGASYVILDINAPPTVDVDYTWSTFVYPFKFSFGAHWYNDTDECLTGNGGCETTCENTRGSYICSCSSGFVLAANSHDCEDINECLTGNGGCQTTCTNTPPGSFTCSCNPGSVLADNGRDCEVSEVTTSAAPLSSSPPTLPDGGSTLPDSGGGSNTTPASSVGPPGDKGDPGQKGAKGERGNTGTNGANGDTGPKGDAASAGAKGDTGVEGDTGPKGAQGNMGNEGSKGEPGIRGDDGTNGQRGERGETGPKGNQGPEGPAGDGTIGPPGSQGPKGDSGEPGPKGDPGSNGSAGGVGAAGAKGGPGAKGDTGTPGTDGSKGDKGQAGLQGEQGPTFSDVNECSVAGVCESNCVNTFGSYYCTCPAGYSLRTDKRTCADINECSVDNGGCQHECLNTDGSFRCVCSRTDEELGLDRKSCIVSKKCGLNNGGCTSGQMCVESTPGNAPYCLYEATASFLAPSSPNAQQAVSDLDNALLNSTTLLILIIWMIVVTLICFMLIIVLFSIRKVQHNEEMQGIKGGRLDYSDYGRQRPEAYLRENIHIY